MLDFNNILATPGADVQYFQAIPTTTTLNWQTWRKPRGTKWIYMLGVGGGGGGGGSDNTSTSAAGGGGGGSGAQTCLMIPSMLVPDMLFIQTGQSGVGANTIGAAGTTGGTTYVCIEPYTTVAVAGTLLVANGGTGGTAGAAGGLGGTAGTGGTITNIGSMVLAGRGFFTVFAGQGGSGGSLSAGTDVTPPTTGLMVTGGAGGGGETATTVGFAGGNIVTIANMLGQDFFPLPISGGSGALRSGFVPATNGGNGFTAKNYLFNFGGAGGGGSTDAGVEYIAGNGGSGAPGCGGGGAGAPNNLALTVSSGGNGGPGFVYIIAI